MAANQQGQALSIPAETFQDLIKGFIDSQVVGRGLDERTAMAYRLDLELFYLWTKEHLNGKEAAEDETVLLEDRMNDYQEYLFTERELRFSTISRKRRVFQYYLDYLKATGAIKGYRRLKPISHGKEVLLDTQLTKAEVDAFFKAIQNEYEELDSGFRKRVCLRDQVMMALLFYHGIEVSELLQLEISDYNPKKSVLEIRRKRQNNRSVYLFSHKLQEQMAWWLSEHAYFEHDGVYSNRLFLSKLGKPISMKMVINIFDKYRVKAGIEKECTPKDLKKSMKGYAWEVMKEVCG